MWEFPIRKVASGEVLLKQGGKEGKVGKGGKKKYLVESFGEWLEINLFNFILWIVQLLVY